MTHATCLHIITLRPAALSHMLQFIRCYRTNRRPAHVMGRIGLKHRFRGAVWRCNRSYGAGSVGSGRHRERHQVGGAGNKAAGSQAV